jgi:hypothetical protein
VDLELDVILVHWQRALASGEVPGGVVEKEPKGRRRSIAIGPLLVRLLRSLKDRQQVEEDAAGARYQRLGYVFCREDGPPYHPTVGADHGVP